MIRHVMLGMGLIVVSLLSAQQRVGVYSGSIPTKTQHDASRIRLPDPRWSTRSLRQMPDVRSFYGAVCRHEWKHIVIRGRGVDWSAELQSPVKAIYRWPMTRSRKKP